jgi:hypothetical protein
LKSDALLLVDEIIRVQLVAYFVGLDLTLHVALPKLEDHFPDLAFVLPLIVFNLLQQQKVDHHALGAASQQNVLAVGLELLPRPLFEAGPGGSLDVIEGLIDGLAVDDPVDSVDELLNAEGGWVSLLEVAVVVVLVLAAEGVDICPDYILQLRQLVLASYRHLLRIILHLLAPVSHLQLPSL